MDLTQIKKDLQDLVNKEEAVVRKDVFDLLMKIKAAEVRQLGFFKTWWNSLVDKLKFKV